MTSQVPHDPRSEMAVIGACLQNLDAIFDAAELVTPEDFHSTTNGHLFAAMLDMVGNGQKTIDTVTVGSYLRARGIGPDVVSPDYMDDCKAMCENPSAVAEYAEPVSDYGQKLRMWRTAKEIEAACMSPAKASAVIPEAEAKLFAVAHRRPSKTGKARTLAEMLPDWLAAIEQRRTRSDSGKTTVGYSTGLKALDEKIDGLVRGRMYVVSAPPAGGKTSLAELFLESVTCDELDVGLFFSQEMTWLEMMDRFMASRGGILADVIKTGQLCDEDWERVETVKAHATEWRLVVDTSKDLTITDIVARVRRHAAQYGDDLGVVVVDYFQLMNFAVAQAGRTNQNLSDVMARVSKAMKDMAGEYNVAVVVLSQLVKSARSHSHVATGADLMGTGGLEADADVVLMVSRPELDPNNPVAATGLANINVVKNRHGKWPAVAEVAFLGRYASFADLPDMPANDPAEAF